MENNKSSNQKLLKVLESSRFPTTKPNTVVLNLQSRQGYLRKAVYLVFKRVIELLEIALFALSFFTANGKKEESH